MKATLDIEGLEQDLDLLFETVKKQVREIQAVGAGPADAETVVQMMITVATLEGMGQLMPVFGRHIEEPVARQRFLKVQQRFAGFKGAARGALAQATRQVARTTPTGGTHSGHSTGSR